MHKTSLHELDAVIAVARRRSFRAAAHELGISTTALSNAVAKLEAGFGVRLFTRTTRSVSLTDAGWTFIEQVSPALYDIQSALETVRSHQSSPSGTLRINSSASAAREILSPLVLEFLRRHPQVHIDLVTEGRLIDVVAEGFDLGVRVSELVPSDMITIPLGRPQRYAVLGSPAYFKDYPVPLVPPDLLHHQCIKIRHPNGVPVKWRFEKNGRVAEIDVRGPITLDEASLARATVMSGIGLAFFIEADVRADVEAGRLIEVLTDWTRPRAPLCLYYPGRRNPSAALNAFVGFAREIQARTPS
ncbi:LysR family transcriptional regulator [Sphingobium fuliginis]|uniref:Transcriptional regulator n=1 Tax=Sphingobium fuliginis (strain ATCC 27551) TaxID=336203 RepID=A0A292ZGM6_SPHSA|nr:LysR family transcriptional regulator [Sphingobium fuliginis]GAY22228.1 transcriptional regulator [Sphingobium fuliginis]